MTDKQDDEKILPDEETQETETQETKAQKSADSKPEDNGTPKGYVTEESYQGLQRVVAKKDKELLDLKGKMETLSTQLEELKANSSQLTGTKSTLEKSLEDAQSQLESLEADRNKLDKQLKQQGIVMSEFPNLAAVAGYIPQADTDEEFRENAKKFSDALGAFVKTGVQEVITGSTPPQPPGDDTVGETEEDRLWDEVYSLAGVQGKEREYKEAYQRLQEVLAAKQ